MGGDVLDVEVSATKKHQSRQAARDDRPAGRSSRPEGQSRTRPAEGTVIEAKLDRGRGPVATVLVQRGTLRGRRYHRRRRRMGPRPRPGVDDHRRPGARQAGPSMPGRSARLLRARRTPATASRWSRAKRAPARSPITAPARSARRRRRAPTGMRGSLEQMMSQLKTAGRKEFPLIIKADVQGSVEAIIGALEKLGTDEVGARIIHAGVGGITESDVTLAEVVGRRRSSASTCAPTRKRARPPSATASRSATTTSSTISSMT